MPSSGRSRAVALRALAAGRGVEYPGWCADVAPAADWKPAGQGVHSVRPALSPYVFFGQRFGGAAGISQKKPGSQLWGCVDPAGQWSPGWHAVMVELSTQWWPASHRPSAMEPAGQYAPGDLHGSWAAAVGQWKPFVHLPISELPSSQ